MSDGIDQAVNTVVAFLTSDGTAWTTDARLDEALEALLPAVKLRHPGLDVAKVRRVVREQMSIVSDEATVLEDNSDHELWLPDVRGELEWLFWERYKLFLKTKAGFAPAVLNRLDLVTDDILGRLEDPNRRGEWDRRGLVVGQVQSGKTSNYTGLICKALDSGYKLIVVLAGVHNSLRSQTQLRIDQSVIGKDSSSKRSFGVGELKMRNPIAHSLTDSSEHGDFKLDVARKATVQLGSDPLILVVKKNASVLNNLHQWVTSTNATQSPSDSRILVRNTPLLVIDDEADSASINTKKPDQDPTKINELIRRILFDFEKSAYVGYTATPFANLFVDHAADGEDLGPDLFPKHFILGLKPPSNYIGPMQVFGNADAPVGTPENLGLPITRLANDYGDWMPDKHRKDHLPAHDLPGSLRTAIRCFVLACAGRNVRGHESAHKSMLIHVTRFVDVQGRVTQQIADELLGLRDQIRGGDPSLLAELRELWRSEFLPTTKKVADLHDPFRLEEHAPISFEQIAAELRPAVSKIEVRAVNGSAKDGLTYNEHKGGLSVIAVGGDKLSRGLTLEGLMVSYYLRASRMYDTLMQMGRWFGYRPDYLDLCRLYTTSDLTAWYRDIVGATDELMAEFQHMSDSGLTPNDYGLRVRRHPGVLMVTAAAKMQRGQKMTLSFQGTVIESITYFRDKERRAEQFDATDRFLRGLGGPGQDRRQFRLWSEVGQAAVIAWLHSIHAHPNARRAVPEYLAEYIATAAEQGEVTDWTVALFSSSADTNPASIAGFNDVGRVLRADMSPDDVDSYRMRRLLDPKHELIDLTEDEVNAARNNLPPGTDLSGPRIRAVRPKKRGLLLLYLATPEPATKGAADALEPPYLGFGFSFPASESAKSVDYVVNPIYLQEELDLDFD